jgi:hypothetical protein
MKRASDRCQMRPDVVGNINVDNLTGKIKSWTVQDLVHNVQISNVEVHSCCGRRVETGKPCWHQILLAAECGVDPYTLYHSGLRAGAWQDQYQFAVAPAEVDKLPSLTSQEPLPRSLAHTHVLVPSGRPKDTKRKAGVLDNDGASGRAPCQKCKSWGHATTNCFQCTRCLKWGHRFKTCRSDLPAGFSYIAHLKRKTHGPVLAWNAKKRSGVKKEPAERS